MHDIVNVQLFQNTLRTATPIILAALGGSLTEKAGIMNIGMDGMILLGAFFGVLGSHAFASSLAGVMLAVLVGVLAGLFFALFTVQLKSDEFIIGVALNLFAAGLTVYLLRTLFGVKGSFSGPGIVGLPALHVAWLESIPVLGPLLNGHSLFVYVSWVLVGALYVFLFHTPQGFWMRASGEHPAALAAAGQSPVRMKYAASVLCGVLCAFAGAHLSLGYLTLFSENMSASRGYIAFACVIFGKASPPKVFFAALLFGFFDALGLRLQSVGIASQLTSLIPYVATVVFLVAFSLRFAKKQKTPSISQAGDGAVG